MTTPHQAADELRPLFEAWYRDTYDGDSPDWGDVDLPLMYQCWRGGYDAARAVPVWEDAAHRAGHRELREAVRDAFAVWVRADRPHWSLRRFDKTQAEEWLRDSYRSPIVQAAWESWQAARQRCRLL